jgi:hypothetical protein
MEYLTDLEKVKIETFCADNDMYEAVKKVLLSGIYSQGVLEKGLPHDPLKNAAFNLASLAVSNPIPDEDLGAHIRSMWTGVNYLHNAFNELDRVKSNIESPYVETNEAI